MTGSTAGRAWLVAAALAIAAMVPLPAAAQQGIDFDLRDWTKQGPDEVGDWQVAADGSEVIQTLNDDPTYFVSSETVDAGTITGVFEVQTAGDNDYIGFVFGYDGPTTDEPFAYDHLLFDWKGGSHSWTVAPTSPVADVVGDGHQPAVDEGVLERVGVVAQPLLAGWDDPTGGATPRPQHPERHVALPADASLRMGYASNGIVSQQVDTDLDLAAAEAFYRDRLPDAGFAITNEPATDASVPLRIVEFTTADGASGNITIQVGDAKATRVSISMIRQG